MPHEFKILREAKIETYSNFDDIPSQFENVIKFAPEIPDGPHTHDQHEEIDSWNFKLQELMKRETNGRSA
jgi:hypothetical protein